MQRSTVSETSSPVKVLIVDDEPSAREIIREMLTDEERSGAVTIVGECGTGHAAVDAIREAKPDVAFLDVQMPEMDGLTVLSTLSPEQLPLVIFVTAYDRYAISAFEVQALDYLLKPFDRERFDQAFARAKRALERERTSDLSERIMAFMEDRNAPSRVSAPPQYIERLAIKADGRVLFVRAEEVEWIKAEGNYVSLHIGKRAYLFRETISSLEAQLDPHKFRRIHRSTIVNIDCITELQAMFRGEYRVLVRGGAELKLSHNYRDNLRQQLGGAL